eukprot:ANDGO_03573.mRNA.1 putative deoxycytidine triphosphate deaminase
MTPSTTGCVLSAGEIKNAVAAGDVYISNFDPSRLGPASYDLSLGNEFRVFRAGVGIVDIKETTDYKTITERVNLEPGKPFILPPQQLCLGITEEEVSLSPRICGLLEGRSRFARLGLVIHITASFMNPGIKNRQVLEIFNASSNPLALYPGERVCQFVFMRMDGEASYAGKFQKQDL